MRTLGNVLFLPLVVIVLSGCASSMSSSAYSRDQTRKVQKVYEGKVVFVREVQIEGTKSGAGAIAGGIMGYALGSAVGKGSGKTIARAGGTVGGAVAGSAIEEGATRQKGLEITVELENGEVVAIVQAADEKFEEGDRVRVLMRPDGTARVLQ